MCICTFPITQALQQFANVHLQFIPTWHSSPLCHPHSSLVSIVCATRFSHSSPTMSVYCMDVSVAPAATSTVIHLINQGAKLTTAPPSFYAGKVAIITGQSSTMDHSRTRKITGATSGIGRATAVRMGAKGAKIVIVGLPFRKVSERVDGCLASSEMIDWDDVRENNQKNLNWRTSLSLGSEACWKTYRFESPCPIEPSDYGRIGLSRQEAPLDSADLTIEELVKVGVAKENILTVRQQTRMIMVETGTDLRRYVQGRQVRTANRGRDDQGVWPD